MSEPTAMREPEKTADEELDHGVITAGPEAHRREKSGHTPANEQPVTGESKAAVK